MVVSASFSPVKLVKLTDSNEIHPSNKFDISFIIDELKWVKSIEIIFMA